MAKQQTITKTELYRAYSLDHQKGLLVLGCYADYEEACALIDLHVPWLNQGPRAQLSIDNEVVLVFDSYEEAYEAFGRVPEERDCRIYAAAYGMGECRVENT